MKKFKKIIFIKTVGTSPQVQLGVMQYVRPRLNWEFLDHLPDPERLARTCREWKVDGGIGQFYQAAVAETVAALKIPFVHIYSGEPMAGLPLVGDDPALVGRMAADYLADLGLRRFGFACTPETSDHHDSATCRWRGFQARLVERKLTDITLIDRRPWPPRDPRHHFFYTYEPSFHRFLRSLKYPVGVFCEADLMARWLVEACRKLNLRVPDDVAIVGVDNNLDICMASYPNLSSIDVPNRQMGYEAARMLEQLLAGRKVKSPYYLPPVGVVPRASTDLLAIEDQEVTKALRYIRERGYEGLHVEQVVDQTALSRCVLERRFRRMIGRSVFAEIRRVQLEHVKKLLHETDMTLERIAAQTGFSLGLRLNREFKNKTGLTPIQYRKQFRHT